MGGGGLGGLVCGGIFFLTYISVGFFFYLALYVMKDFFFIVGIFLLPGIPLQEFFFPLKSVCRIFFSQITHTLPPFKIQMVVPSLDRSQQWNPSLTKNIFDTELCCVVRVLNIDFGTVGVLT